MDSQQPSNNTKPHNSARNSQETLQEINDDDTAIPVIVIEAVTRNSQEATHRRTSSKPVCRICFGTESMERLLSPCMCKGTIGFVHRQCLEHWLGSTNTERCELCHHVFTTFRTRKRLWDWCVDPSTQTDRKNIFGDILCFLCLTPLGLITFYMCIKGAYYFYEYEEAVVEATSLVGLAAFLIFAYFTWITLSLKYHYSSWLIWRMNNWNIRIIMPSDSNCTIEDNNNQEQDEDVQVNDSTLTNKENVQVPSSAENRNSDNQKIKKQICRNHPSEVSNPPGGASAGRAPIVESEEFGS